MTRALSLGRDRGRPRGRHGRVSSMGPYFRLRAVDDPCQSGLNHRTRVAFLAVLGPGEVRSLGVRKDCAVCGNALWRQTGLCRNENARSDPCEVRAGDDTEAPWGRTHPEICVPECYRALTRSDWDCSSSRRVSCVGHSFSWFGSGQSVRTSSSSSTNIFSSSSDDEA